jgi:hypothetical protein
LGPQEVGVFFAFDDIDAGWVGTAGIGERREQLGEVIWHHAGARCGPLPFSGTVGATLSEVLGKEAADLEQELAVLIGIIVGLIDVERARAGVMAVRPQATFLQGVDDEILIAPGAAGDEEFAGLFDD